jgi:outer membrane protein assembly factor BamB
MGNNNTKLFYVGNITFESLSRGLRPKARNSIVNLITLLIALALSNTCFAQDWNQWRGPNRDAVVASFSAPSTWPDKLKPLWKIQVGIGHSSPVVAGKRVYLHSRKDENEVVSCFDLDSGKQLWTDSYPTPYKMNPAAVTHGKGPKSTPVVSDNKLFTLGISGILSCYDAANGKLLWRREFSKTNKATSPLFGTAMSPLVDRGLLIAHVGGHDSGTLAAFDTGTGETRWEWSGDGPGYASPIIVEIGGTRQIVTQTQKHIVGVSASKGQLLWEIPFETEFLQNIVTPVIYKQTLILSGIDKGVFAVQPLLSGGVGVTEQLWANTDVSMYMNSPVLIGDYVYGLSNKRKGQFFCLDARTGKTQWVSNGREGDNAAIVAAGQFLMLLTEGAELVIARADPKQFEIIKKYSVADSPTWAHPVLVGKRVLIKDASSLALLGLE